MYKKPILIIDTSTDKGVVAFVFQERVLFCDRLPLGAGSSQKLFMVISAGFKKLALTAKDLCGIGVGKGPGFFTGIRTGVAMAKGIAYAACLPLVGFYSLEGFLSSKEGRFASVILLKQGGGHCLIQERKSTTVHMVEKPRFYQQELLLSKLEEEQEIVGPSFQNFSYIKGREVFPDPLHLADLTQKKLLQKKAAVTEELVLSYSSAYAS